MLAIVLLSAIQLHAADVIPSRAKLYKATVRAEVRRQWGLTPPVDTIPVLAATIHKESAWNPMAANAIAHGLAQFTVPTWSWITQLDPSIAQLGDVWNPTAAIRAAAYYHHYLWDQVPAKLAQDRWAGVLSSYNGGLGWYQRDRKKAGTERWFGGIDHVNAGRNAGAFAENRRYVDQIWWRWRCVYADF